MLLVQAEGTNRRGPVYPDPRHSVMRHTPRSNPQDPGAIPSANWRLGQKHVCSPHTVIAAHCPLSVHRARCMRMWHAMTMRHGGGDTVRVSESQWTLSPSSAMAWRNIRVSGSPCSYVLFWATMSLLNWHMLSSYRQ